MCSDPISNIYQYQLHYLNDLKQRKMWYCKIKCLKIKRMCVLHQDMKDDFVKSVLNLGKRELNFG